MHNDYQLKTYNPMVCGIRLSELCVHQTWWQCWSCGWPCTCVITVQEWAEHASPEAYRCWESGVGCSSISVTVPGVYLRGKSGPSHTGRCEIPGNNGSECSPIVYEHVLVVVHLVQVGKSSVEGHGDGVICWPVWSVHKLSGEWRWWRFCLKHFMMGKEGTAG